MMCKDLAQCSDNVHYDNQAIDWAEMVSEYLNDPAHAATVGVICPQNDSTPPPLPSTTQHRD